MTLTDQMIELLETEPDNWRQGDHTLDYLRNFEIWTSNMPIFDLYIYSHNRYINIFEKCRLWWAIKKWNRRPLKLLNTDKD